MTRIIDILKEFAKEIEKNNPFNLILKGGTALSIYYLKNHRESEDLDFDADKSLIKEHDKMKNYFVDIFDKLKQKQLIKDHRITKSGFASTNRYHIKIELKTYKTFYSKIDVDFVEIPKNLTKKGQLNLYSLERIFVGKSLTFVNRKEFKDLYDISYLIDKIDISGFGKKENVIELIHNVIQVMKREYIKKIYKTAFRNVDLRFKDLKESKLDSFIQNTTRKLYILINKLKRI